MFGGDFRVAPLFNPRIRLVATSTRRRRRVTNPDGPFVPQIQQTDLADITPYEFNPRDNEAAIESTANSIRSFGFLVPIIIDSEGVIVAGHTRYAAAHQLGFTEVPTINASHLDPDQVKQFRIIDNKVAEQARWDFDLLAGELQALADSGLDWTRYGFTQEEVDCFGDVVGEDCLGTGGMADMNATAAQQRAERRAPSQTRFVLGDLPHFFISQEQYRQWASELRNLCDYDDAEIVRHIKDLLHLPPSGS